MKNLLYFPYINLPNTEWTIRNLLYYDKVGSIVPESYNYNPDKYEPFMRKLVQNELVIPINPFTALERIADLDRPFLDFASHPSVTLEQKRKAFKVETERINSVSNQVNLSIHRIHTQKFNYELLYSLEKLGLAKRNGEWYYVEKSIAKHLMVYLSTLIANKLDMRMATDSLDNLPRRIWSPRMEKNSTQREKILTELIPYPRNINLEALLEFKEKHSGLLKIFINTIEQIVLTKEYDNNEALLTLKIEELKHRKEELANKMAPRGFKHVVFGTVCGILKGVIAVGIAKTGGAAVAATPNFANSIYSALKIESPEKVYDQSGMKYIALMEKRIRTRRTVV
jgi:hypothetical protein